MGQHTLFASFLLFGVLVLNGCVQLPSQVEKRTYQAVAVWQHDSGNGWDIYYSLWDDENKEWFNYENSVASAPIAMLSGNDDDPDVYSNSKKAIAVWSHTGENGQNIYFSTFEGESWASPAPLSTIAGKDLDPTVAMAEDSALVVWVNELDGRRELYYSYYENGTWSAAKRVYEGADEKVNRPESVSLPELTYNAGGVYVLIFTGKVGEGNRAFGATFAKGSWTTPAVIPGQITDAQIDLSSPTEHRTGAGSNLGGTSIVVWGDAKGLLYFSEYAKGFGDAKRYSAGVMPDVAYDSAGISHSLYSSKDAIEHAYDVVGVDAIRPAFDTAGPDKRVSMTFIRERRNGLAVWWATVIGESEIFFSRMDQNWSAPLPVEKTMLKGSDRNPAITPLEKVSVMMKEWCPDGVLDAGEQCEVGIPCPNPNDFCNLRNCLCYPQVQKTYCGDGIVQKPNSLGWNEECEKGVPCVRQNFMCDEKNCLCFLITTGPEANETPVNGTQNQTRNETQNVTQNVTNDTIAPSVGCAENTRYVDIYDVNPFKYGVQQCIDNCAQGYKCVPSSCTCIKETTNTTTKTSVSCWSGYQSFDPNKNICINDCPRGYECMEACYCKRTIVDTDGDGREDEYDNCPRDSNPKQEDRDGDGKGDVCDDCPDDPYNDRDGDEICGNEDNCPSTFNPDQRDRDQDQVGDACDACPDDYYGDEDNDKVCESDDNCPEIYNPKQEDRDGDGIGDHCDEVPVDCEQEGAAYLSKGAVILGEDVSANTCGALLEEGAGQMTCTTLCMFSYLKMWSWSVGGQTVNTYTCCYGYYKYLPCTDCPGQNPQCPSENDCARYNIFPD